MTRRPTSVRAQPEGHFSDGENWLQREKPALLLLPAKILQTVLRVESGGLTQPCRPSWGRRYTT
jgi:hypothetical protein